MRDSVNKTVEHRLNSDSVAFQFALQVTLVLHSHHFIIDGAVQSVQRDSRQQSESVRELQRDVRQMQTDMRALSLPQLQSAGKGSSEAVEQLQKEISVLQSVCPSAYCVMILDESVQSVASANAECAGIHKMFKAHQNFAANIRDAHKTQNEKVCTHACCICDCLMAVTVRCDVSRGGEVSQPASKRDLRSQDADAWQCGEAIA